MKFDKDLVIAMDEILLHLKDGRQPLQQTINVLYTHRNPKGVALNYYEAGVEELEDQGFLNVTGDRVQFLEITTKGKEIVKLGGMVEKLKRDNIRQLKDLEKEEDDYLKRKLDLKNAQRQVWSFRLSVGAIIISFISLLYTLFFNK
ncbi:hypothetical protein [Flavihumibacter profundi]|uniref:hypothetical protein n=1 Tax=Flavihumibacter profundi TaxID=2716883 RepID=UPI001CC7E51F|nr:hypothetical protein [Flavihumibacter profundi]MBZ5857762.1 hypothetical protein [Flavihumibacter profundi]